MRKALIKVHDRPAGILEEQAKEAYCLRYLEDYQGPPISLTLPLSQRVYFFATFPPFFEGLLPEGIQLEGLLRAHKIDAEDYFSQLLAVGDDLVGAVTLEEIADES